MNAFRLPSLAFILWHRLEEGVDELALYLFVGADDAVLDFQVRAHHDVAHGVEPGHIVAFVRCSTTSC